MSRMPYPLAAGLLALALVASLSPGGGAATAAAVHSPPTPAASDNELLAELRANAAMQRRLVQAQRLREADHPSMLEAEQNLAEAIGFLHTLSGNQRDELIAAQRAIVERLDILVREARLLADAGRITDIELAALTHKRAAARLRLHTLLAD